tara:strand:+ start:1335 stop:2183 length:849 start_codon:yes stop_codon:yes gene_type:complete
LTILITGLPRSGTSLTASLVSSAGYKCSIGKSILGSSDLNRNGYFEDIDFILFNDQLIRFFYGNKFSFLFPPQKQHFKELKNFNNGWKYDIDDNTLDIPDKYLDEIELYSDLGWDVWGLTRMQNGGKWNKCYSRRLIHQKSDLLIKLKFYKNKINQIKSDFFLKDPRLVFTLDLIADPKITKVIILSRKPEANTNSIRRHYGKRIFTNNPYPRKEWVSNHFNMKVGYMAEKNYYQAYEDYIEAIQNKFNTLKLSFEKILEKGEEIDKLESFVCAKVNRDLIN